MSKHTPGPWRFVAGIYLKQEDVPPTYSGPGFYNNPGIVGANGNEVVGCDEYDVFTGATPEERAANVRLIAAAPDMLEALRKADAVIKAALLNARSGDAYDAFSRVQDNVRSAIAKAEGAP